jgi:branched-chain amino acid transport system substrate-binding protein
VVLGSEFDAPQGHVSIDGNSNHTNLWTRIGMINATGRFDIMRESLRAVTPDPYLVSH